MVYLGNGKCLLGVAPRPASETSCRCGAGFNGANCERCASGHIGYSSGCLTVMAEISLNADILTIAFGALPAALAREHLLRTHDLRYPWSWLYMSHAWQLPLL